MAVAGIKVGDLVRVRASVTRPEYGWGYVNHTSIGPVHSLTKDEVTVDFPEQAFWIGLTSELEVVDHSGGETLFLKKKLSKSFWTTFRNNYNDHPEARRWVKCR